MSFKPSQIITAFMVLLICLTTFTTETFAAETAKHWNKKGMSYFQKGDLDKAIECFDKSIELDSNFVEAYENSAMAYFGKNEVSHAIDLYTKALSIDPNNTGLYALRGVLYFSIGKVDEGIEDIFKVMPPTHSLAQEYAIRGMVEFLIGEIKDKDIHQASEYFEKAIELDSKCALAYNGRAMVIIQTQDKDEKIANSALLPQIMDNLLKAAEADPNYKDAQNNLGGVYFSLEDYDQAIQYYNRAIALNSKVEKNQRGEAYKGLGDCYLKKGNIERAIKNYSKEVRINSENKNAYIHRGNLYYQQGAVDLAIADFQKVLSLDSDNKIAKNNLKVAVLKKSDTLLQWNFSQRFEMNFFLSQNGKKK